MNIRPLRLFLLMGIAALAFCAFFPQQLENLIETANGAHAYWIYQSKLRSERLVQAAAEAERKAQGEAIVRQQKADEEAFAAQSANLHRIQDLSEPGGKIAEGYVRYLISAPSKDLESTYIDLIVEKELDADDCNSSNYSGEIKRLADDFKVRYLQLIIHGRRSIAEECRSAPGRKQLVGVTYSPQFLENLKTYIDIPIGFQVRYRVWKASQRHKAILVKPKET